jgi:hypothetical protein
MLLNALYGKRYEYMKITKKVVLSFIVICPSTQWQEFEIKKGL